MKNKILLIFLFVALYGLSFKWAIDHRPVQIKTITKTQTVVVQKPFPKLYICNSQNTVDLTDCFEINPQERASYCFSQNCSYIYPDSAFANK